LSDICKTRPYKKNQFANSLMEFARRKTCVRLRGLVEKSRVLKSACAGAFFYVAAVSTAKLTLS
jgi:hypothetical protein